MIMRSRWRMTTHAANAPKKRSGITLGGGIMAVSAIFWFTLEKGFVFFGLVP